jgi:hypothetical protein
MIYITVGEGRKHVKFNSGVPYNLRKGGLCWGDIGPVIDLVSAAKCFVRFSWYSVKEFFQPIAK